MHILGSIYCGSYGEREGKFTDIRVHLLRILWREGGFTHIRVHLLRIIWREGRKVHTYQGPSLEDPMERGKGSSYKLRFIYLGSLEKRRKGSNILGSIY